MRTLTALGFLLLSCGSPRTLAELGVAGITVASADPESTWLSEPDMLPVEIRFSDAAREACWLPLDARLDVKGDSWVPLVRGGCARFKGVVPVNAGFRGSRASVRAAAVDTSLTVTLRDSTGTVEWRDDSYFVRSNVTPRTTRLQRGSRLEFSLDPPTPAKFERAQGVCTWLSEAGDVLGGTHVENGGDGLLSCPLPEPAPDVLRVEFRHGVVSYPVDCTAAERCFGQRSFAGGPPLSVALVN